VNDAIPQLFDPSNAPGLGPDPRPARASIMAVDRELAAFFAANPLQEDARALVRALALLWHDHLDEAHEIVQDHSSGDGAYLHGIMHRREADYWNAKYWFRRVGGQPFFGSFGGTVAAMPGGAAFTVGGLFDPAEFVDAVELSVRRRSGALSEAALIAIQAAEFQALLDHLTAA
jgi:hypothetical protein